VFRASGILIALLLLGSQAGSAAYYSVTGGGLQFQIGDGERPMPIQPPTTGGTKRNQVGTGTMFPPLLVPVNPDPAKALVQQTAGPDPKKITIPPGVLVRKAPGRRRSASYATTPGCSRCARTSRSPLPHQRSARPY
jgi:hypothetical protein